MNCVVYFSRLWRANLMVAVSAVLLVVTGCASNPADRANLEYWTADSPAAASLVQFVTDATNPDSPQFIPLEDRLAVFDMDGTIIGELFPSYFDWTLFLHRVLHDDSYQAPPKIKAAALKTEQSLKEEVGKLPKEISMKQQAQYAAEVFKGMTLAEFDAYTRAFMKSKAEGFENLQRGDAFYKPMVSLINYLVANNFQVYVVSGTDRMICRSLVAGVLNIQPYQVIGSDYKLKASGQGKLDGLDYTYQVTDTIIREGSLIQKTLDMNKVELIERDIGKQPVLAFGNTLSDLAMINYAVQNKRYGGRGYYVLCDDIKREYGKLAKAAKLKELCEKEGFYTISMRDDFATIYGDQVTLSQK